MIRDEYMLLIETLQSTWMFRHVNNILKKIKKYELKKLFFFNQFKSINRVDENYPPKLKFNFNLIWTLVSKPSSEKKESTYQRRICYRRDGTKCQ